MMKHLSLNSKCSTCNQAQGDFVPIHLKYAIDLHPSKPIIIGPYNLHYLLFSLIGALLCHHPYCLPSQSQSLFGIGAGQPEI